MMDKVQKYWNECQIGVFSAAVSDYRPAEKADQKIKKSDDEMVLRLIKNPDILAWAGKNKAENQVLMGFALETNKAEEHAKGKLERKNLDFIVVNTLEDEGAGFGVDTNRIKIMDKNNNLTKFELKSKREVAQDIVQYLKENI